VEPTAILSVGRGGRMAIGDRGVEATLEIAGEVEICANQHIAVETLP